MDFNFRIGDRVKYRNPLEHLVSHIAHFRCMDKKEHYALFNNSSEETQLLTQKLLSSPEAITYLYRSLTNSELLLFDNCQVRYFIKGLGYKPDGWRIGFQEMEVALKTLKTIYIVGIVGVICDIQTFLDTVFLRMG